MMNKAIFLDRDGVINDPGEHYYVHRVEDFSINEGVIEALGTWQERDYLLILISNQGGIARGLFSKEDTDRVHRYLEEVLAGEGIYLSAIYYCPHHDSVERCLCRKPEPLLLQKAMARFGIEPEDAWFIGDSDKDVEAGKRTGIHTRKIRRNQDLRTLLPEIR